MNNLFAPEFLSEDWRTRRPPRLGLPMSDEFTIQKHVQCLPPEIIKDKHILDLGSFIGQTGHWCLTHGAASYTGVEINPEFADKSRELLTKYHSDQPWTVITSSIQDYCDTNDKKFDLVFTWGVMFYHVDHTWFLKQMVDRADHVIVSTKHPKIIWRAIGSDFTDQQWNYFEYELAYTEIQDRVMTGMLGHMLSVKNLSSNSSIASVCAIMKSYGFRPDLSAYENLKRIMPDQFGMFKDPNQHGLYVIDFKKDPTIEMPATMENIYKNPKLWNENHTPWNPV